MYKITIFSVIDDCGNTVILPQPLTLPQTAERLQLSDADVPLATLKTNDYRFESVNLNAKITGEQSLYDLNKLARHIRGMSENEMDALCDFAEHSTKLTPADCTLLKMRYPILTHGSRGKRVQVASNQRAILRKSSHRRSIYQWLSATPACRFPRH